MHFYTESIMNSNETITLKVDEAFYVLFLHFLFTLPRCFAKSSSLLALTGREIPAIRPGRSPTLPADGKYSTAASASIEQAPKQ